MLTLLLLIFWAQSNCSYLGKFSLTSVQERITAISAPWDLCMEREERNKALNLRVFLISLVLKIPFSFKFELRREGGNIFTSPQFSIALKICTTFTKRYLAIDKLIKILDYLLFCR